MDKDDQNKKSDRNLEEWARHYDTLLWTVTTIMGTAIGGLLVYLNSNKFNLWLSIFGFILTLIAVYLATSFRILRHNIEKEYDENLRKKIKSQKLFQWPVYLLIFFLLGTFWIKLLIENRIELLWLWILLACGGTGLIVYWWMIGKGNRIQ